MKVNFINEIEEVRGKVTKQSDLTKFDEFLSEVQVFDMNDDEHVQKARACCTHCCEHVEITNTNNF